MFRFFLLSDRWRCSCRAATTILKISHRVRSTVRFFFFVYRRNERDFIIFVSDFFFSFFTLVLGNKIELNKPPDSDKRDFYPVRNSTPTVRISGIFLRKNPTFFDLETITLFTPQQFLSSLFRTVKTFSRT